MNTKFTPGPWRIEHCPCGFASCDRYGTSNGTFYQGNGYSQADANLVAAAPDLYEALHSALSLLKCYVGDRTDDLGNAVVSECQSALKKARGEA